MRSGTHGWNIHRKDKSIPDFSTFSVCRSFCGKRFLLFKAPVEQEPMERKNTPSAFIFNWKWNYFLFVCMFTFIDLIAVLGFFYSPPYCKICVLEPGFYIVLKRFGLWKVFNLQEQEPASASANAGVLRVLSGIELTFKTRSPDGLLLCAFSPGNQDEFVAIQIKGGRPYFLFDPQV